jgi:maleate cis-trans isomerase
MLEAVIPKVKIGVMQPLPVIGVGAYEFYLMAPPGVLLEMITGSLTEFSEENAEASFATLDKKIDMLKSRHVDLIMQSGVPPALLVGMKNHDRIIDRIATRAGVPATSSVLGVVAAAKNVGIKKIVAANRWKPHMNAVLGEFFKREGIELLGVANQSMPAGTMQKRPLEDGLGLSYQLGRQAFEQYPEADGLYIGGSAWMVQASCEKLEQDFGKPVVANKNAMVWNTLHRVGYWTPIQGHGRVLASN